MLLFRLSALPNPQTEGAYIRFFSHMTKEAK